MCAGLVSSCSHCSSCMLRAVQGCLRYLDQIPSSKSKLPLEDMAWSCLSAGLCGLAELFVASWAEEGEGDERHGVGESQGDNIFDCVC